MTGDVMTLGELAHEVRSKNAGPFWITFDVIMKTDSDYQLVVDSGALSGAVVAELYAVDPGTVRVFEMPGIRVVKVSFPRPCPAGSFADRDLHAGQQHVPMLGIQVAGPTPSRYRGQ